MNKTLRVATYNIHKGFSFFNRRMVIHELRERLRMLGADLVFLQEVLGEHQSRGRSHISWPGAPQYEFLADRMWGDFAYGRNAVYDSGDHGNAILSRFPITRWDNQDISAHRFERRGLLHCEVDIPDWPRPLHGICVHLGLLARGRSRQLERLRQRIEKLVPADAPLIVAGDFNDWHWRNKATYELAHPLGMHEVFEFFAGVPARSFPSMLPVLRLDRIYVRGFAVSQAKVHHGPGWDRISDHAALTTTLLRL